MVDPAALRWRDAIIRCDTAAPCAMLFALSHLVSLGMIGALFYATGWVLDAIAGPFELRVLGNAVVRIGLGSVVWIYLLFALACVGGYHAQCVVPLAATLLLSAAAVRALGMRGTVRPALPVAARLQDARSVLAWLLPGLILISVFVRGLSAQIGWDDDVYHLTLPKLYLRHGGFRRIAWNVYSHWPHGVELLYGMAMMVQDYVLAKLLHTLFLALVIVAVYRRCRTQAPRLLACTASLLVLGNDVVQYEGAVANVDIAFGFYFLMAVECADQYLRASEARLLVLCGVFCGALAGTKLSGLVGVVCIAVLLGVSRPRWFLQPKQLLVPALTLGVPTLLLAAPWYIKTYLYTGNPLYPLFFKQLGGIEWSAQLSQQFFAWQDGMGMGRSLRDYLLLPLRVVLDADYGYARFDGRIGQFWLLATPLSLFVWPSVGRGRSELICACMYFVFWALSSQQLRFLIAALPLLAIAACLAAASLTSRMTNSIARTALHAALLVATCCTAWPMLRPSLDQASSEATRLVEQGPADPKTAIPPGIAFINEHTRPSSKILLINGNGGFFLERAYIADSFGEASQLSWLMSGAATQQQLMAIFRSLSVTHLYVLGRKHRPITLPASFQQVLEDRQRASCVFRIKRSSCLVYQLR